MILPSYGTSIIASMRARVVFSNASLPLMKKMRPSSAVKERDWKTIRELEATLLKKALLLCFATLAARLK